MSVGFLRSAGRTLQGGTAEQGHQSPRGTAGCAGLVAAHGHSAFHRPDSSSGTYGSPTQSQMIVFVSCGGTACVG